MKIFRKPKAQVVQVSMWPGAWKRYSYSWDGEPPLRLGEIVIVPSAFAPGAAHAVMVKVFGPSPTYNGPLVPVTRRATQADALGNREWEVLQAIRRDSLLPRDHKALIQQVAPRALMDKGLILRDGDSLVLTRHGQAVADQERAELDEAWKW